MNRLTVLPRMASRCFFCRYNSTAAAAQAKAPALDIPPGTNEARVFSPKIQSLVDQIAQLNLLEVADLNECLKKTLKIEAMPMAMAGPAVVAQAETAEDSAQESKAAVKSSFTVKLTKFDESKKVAVIKEVKNLVEGLNLVQAKKFVESLPQIIRTDVGKDEAAKIKTTLEALGATVTLE